MRDSKRLLSVTPISNYLLAEGKHTVLSDTRDVGAARRETGKGGAEGWVKSVRWLILALLLPSAAPHISTPATAYLQKLVPRGATRTHTTPYAHQYSLTCKLSDISSLTLTQIIIQARVARE